jgi:peptide/nickel transport system substrate-binding protein
MLYVFDGLTRAHVTEQGVVMGPCLAESWEFTDENRTIIWHLRDDVFWHDGEKFTTEDVKFTMDALMDPDTGASLRGQWDSLISTDIIDDYTVKMSFTAPKATVLMLASSPTLGIVPEHVLSDVPHSEWRTHYFETLGVKGGPYPGTGPYKMVDWKSGEYIQYEAFENYWEGEPPVKNMYWRFIDEPNTALVALQNQEINYLHSQIVDPIITQIQELEDSDAVSINWFGGITTPWVAFNLHHPILSNRYVRLAIAHAIPVQRIIDDLLNGLAIPATGPIPSASRFFPEGLTPYTYDPELAKEYLAKAGYSLPEPTPPPQPSYTSLLIGAVVGIAIGAIAGNFLLKKQ